VRRTSARTLWSLFRAARLGPRRLARLRRARNTSLVAAAASSAAIRSAAAPGLPRPGRPAFSGLCRAGNATLRADVAVGVFPGVIPVLIGECVEGPFLDAALVFHQSREDTVVVLGVPKILVDERGRVGVVHHPAS